MLLQLVKSLAARGWHKSAVALLDCALKVAADGVNALRGPAFTKPSLKIAAACLRWHPTMPSRLKR